MVWNKSAEIMTTAYPTIIEGKSRDIIGMDADGKYLLNSDEKLWIKPFKKGEIARSRKLKKVSKLTFTDREWLLDGKNIKAQIITARMDRHKSGEIHTELRTLDWLYEILPGDDDETKIHINGVAWFEESSDKVEGQTTEHSATWQDSLDLIHGIGKFSAMPPLPPAKEFRPVLLADFCITSRRNEGAGQHAFPLLPNAKPERLQLSEKSQSKPEARFEDDYQIAVIPTKHKGKELNLSLEPELRTLIKEIIVAGGRLSRKEAIQKFTNKHGKANSENYQPEKLFRSKIAITLIKAGLLGTDKASRTSVFWAKVQAG